MEIIRSEQAGVMQFGIQVGDTYIHEITTEQREAEALLRWLEDNEVSEIHVLEVIEDWFGRSVE